MRVARSIATSFAVSSLLPFPPTSIHSSFTSHRSVGVQLFFASAMSTTTTPSVSPPVQNNVRIVSYNLLSSKLARPSHFTRANPDHLEYEYRLPLVLAKLEEAMHRDFCGRDEGSSQSAPPPTIYALQEVCYPFASALHTFFAQRGYHFVTGLYGRPFNG